MKEWSSLTDKLLEYWDACDNEPRVQWKVLDSLFRRQDWYIACGIPCIFD